MNGTVFNIVSKSASVALPLIAIRPMNTIKVITYRKKKPVTNQCFKRFNISFKL